MMDVALHRTMQRLLWHTHVEPSDDGSYLLLGGKYGLLSFLLKQIDGHIYPSFY